VCFFILVSFFGYCECILCFVVLCPVVTNRHGVDDVDGDDNEFDYTVSVKLLANESHP